MPTVAGPPSTSCYSRPPKLDLGTNPPPGVVCRRIGPVAVVLNAGAPDSGQWLEGRVPGHHGRAAAAGLLEGEHPTDAQTKVADSAASSWAGDRIGLYGRPQWSRGRRSCGRDAQRVGGAPTSAGRGEHTLDGLSSPPTVLRRTPSMRTSSSPGHDRVGEFHHLSDRRVGAAAGVALPPGSPDPACRALHTIRGRKDPEQAERVGRGSSLPPPRPERGAPPSGWAGRGITPRSVQVERRGNVVASSVA